MTFERIWIPGLGDREQDVLDRLLKQLDVVQARNLLRSGYYEYESVVRTAGGIIPPYYSRLGILLGWSAKAVDILSRRCNLDGFVWPDGELDDLGMSELWEGNHLGSEVSSATISSLIHGVSFLVNTRGEGDEPAALIHVRDALNATGEWNARTRRLDNFVSIHERNDRGKPTALALYLPDLTITAGLVDGVWRVERQSHSWGVPAEPLVYKSRVGRPFGSSRISGAVMSLHDQALRSMIRMEAHMDVYSIPEMWLLGADESIFKNDDGSYKSAYQVMLGRIKVIPDDDDAANPRADVQQFQASSPEPHLLALRQQAQMFSGETSIPLSSLGVSDMANPTSADSYIASREDIIAEAEGATDDWAPALQRSVQRALAMANGESKVPKEWASIAPKWRSPLYLSRAAQADAGSKQIASVPWLAETSVGLELLGLDDQQIKQAMAEKRRNAGSAALRQVASQLAPLASRNVPVAQETPGAVPGAPEGPE